MNESDHTIVDYTEPTHIFTVDTKVSKESYDTFNNFFKYMRWCFPINSFQNKKTRIKPIIKQL